MASLALTVAATATPINEDMSTFMTKKEYKKNFPSDRNGRLYAKNYSVYGFDTIANWQATLPPKFLQEATEKLVPPSLFPNLSCILCCSIHVFLSYFESLLRELSNCFRPGPRSQASSATTLLSTS